MSNVQVKPLEWEDWSAQHRTNLTAMTQFGRYGVMQLHFPEMHYKIEPPVGKPLSALTLEAAKAAAQADYERRILGALQAPDTSREYIQRMIACAPFADQTAGIPEMVATLRALLAERDLADARAAAAWIEGRDALANHISAMMTRCAEANDKTYPSYAEDMRDWATDVTNEAGDLHPPADASAALDRLIAERVRYERREAFEEAADIVEKECNRILSKQDGTVAQVDANLRLIALLLPDIEAALRERGSKEGRDA